MPADFANELQLASNHLKSHDPFLKPVIEQVGPATFEPHQDYYGALVSSIIGQQLSVKAAAAIKLRFKDLFGGHFPEPNEILKKSVEDLRAIGFSNAKARYVQDLAEHMLESRIRFDRIDKQSNEEIIAELTDVKGIGEWTVHMFLMFCVGRLDVLPVGDLGVRNGVGKLYGFDGSATPEQVIEVAEKYNWHPYESVASWYIWQSLDNEPL